MPRLAPRSNAALVALVALVATLLAGCGGSGAMSGGASVPRVVPPEYLLELGAARTPTLVRPTEQVDALDAHIREAAAGADRRAALRAAALGHMFDAEGKEGRDERRARREANRLATSAARNSREEYLVAEMAFVELWNAWRSGARNAERLAERFTTRQLQAGELIPIAWAVRGEIALDEGRFDDAAEAFRYLLGMVEHPLYAYGLWRTAHAYRGAERADDARQALEEARQLGCGRAVDPLVLRIANTAARELGGGARTDADGTVRPASCPVEAEPEVSGEGDNAPEE